MGTGAEPVPTFVGVLSRPGRKPSGRFGLEERVMGVEPTTATLATWRSTTELHPRGEVFALSPNYKCVRDEFKGRAAGIRRTAGGGTRTLTGLAPLRIFVPLRLSPP